MIINFFSDFCFPGGIPVHQGILAERLHTLFGHTVRVCVPWPLLYDVKEHKQLIEKAFRDNTLEQMFFGLKYLERIETKQQLNEIIQNADINHFHGSFSTNREFLGEAIYASPEKQKNVYTFHSEAVNPKCESDIFELRKRISNINIICGVSRNVQKAVKSIFPKRDIIITDNGYSVAANDDCSVSSDRPFTILYIARLNKSKGIENVIKLAEDIKGSDIRLIIVGHAEFDKIYDAKMNNFIGISNIIWIKESLPYNEVLDLYKCADIFYFPSHMEGRPLVVLDAIANGCIPVVSKVGSLDDIIVDGKNGYLFDFDDYKNQYETIITLYKNPKLLHELKKNVLTTQLTSWNETAGKLDMIYRSICNA